MIEQDPLNFFSPYERLVAGHENADHRALGHPNLFIADGSVMSTEGAANPALTIMALSSRLAERLAGKRVAATTGRARGAVTARA